MPDFTNAFRGQVTTTTYVSSSPGVPVGIVMPADVQAGDYLFIIGGQFDLNILAFLPGTDPTIPTGWEYVNQGPQAFVKIADGSEGGSTVMWPSRDTTNFSGTQRACVVTALCYRWPTPPMDLSFYAPAVANGTVLVAQLRLFSQDSSNGGAGPYPGVAVFPYEVRILGMNGESTDEFALNEDALASATWYGDNVTDRTGLHSQPWSGSGLPDATSGSVADAIIPPGITQIRTPDSGVTITGILPFASGFINAAILAWPDDLAYWGINATTPF